MIFGIMFFAVARDPIANRNLALIPYGMLLGNSATVAIVSWHWFVLNSNCRDDVQAVRRHRRGDARPVRGGLCEAPDLGGDLATEVRRGDAMN